MIIAFFLAALAAIVTGSYLTNPFSKFSRIRRTFMVELGDDTFTIMDENHKLKVSQALWWRAFAMAKNGVHILTSRYVSSPQSKSTTVEGIITDIHSRRFNPQKLLVTSGDHFSALYVRNLGVFYYPMLDTRIEGSENDWRDRQVIYLQTLAYALGVYAKHPVPTTTIVPTGAYRATCINIYAYPSDTVYGLLYALSALLGTESAAPAKYGGTAHVLDTISATETLLQVYKPTLAALYKHYMQTVFDGSTGLIKRGIHLSGAKDITRRDCSFYDNVALWKTMSLAMELGLAKRDEKLLNDLKARIIKTFWLEGEGYFLEDLSDEGVQEKYYSSDWLIVLVTGFLDPAKADERRYFERIVEHIQKEDIDKPFPLQYHKDTRRHRQFFIVRMAVASYGGDAIWSFWGMEYIKALLLLYKHTGKRGYLSVADKHIKTYETNMVRDGGFPEVYDSKGRLLQTPLYRSIRQTGWVIGFEQARTMRDAIVTARAGSRTKEAKR